MKKIHWCVAVFLLTTSMSLYALGLGEMHVKSSLDQPFVAEIKLIDARSAKLTNIKIRVADSANYGRLGLRPTTSLNLLHFKVEKNESNQSVVKIESFERMTEPYMDLVVDLLWPDGQLFKAYKVILDPADYQLTSSSVQNDLLSDEKIGIIEQPIKANNSNFSVTQNDARKELSYGPTLPNENIWSLAQRYKMPGVTLPQVVLAIMGANPAGFDNGNLNGLKVGIRLNIPTIIKIQEVPAQLAGEEIQAHDLAWNTKTPIQHVIAPPYLGATVVSPGSIVPELPQFTQHTSQLNSKEFTVAAIIALKKSNVLLKEQLQLIHTQNKALQQRIDTRDKDIQLIQQQMLVIMKQQQDIVSHAKTSSAQSQSSNQWLWAFLLSIAVGSGAYWYFNRRTVNDGMNAISKLNPIPIHPEDTPNVFVDDAIDHHLEKEREEENSLEFEPGLHELISNEAIQLVQGNQEISLDEDEKNKEYLTSLFLTDSLDTNEQNEENKQSASWSEAEANELAYLLRNIQVFDTLEEVQEHGTNSQKEEVASLLLSDTR